MIVPVAFLGGAASAGSFLAQTSGGSGAAELTVLVALITAAEAAGAALAPRMPAAGARGQLILAIAARCSSPGPLLAPVTFHAGRRGTGVPRRRGRAAAGRGHPAGSPRYDACAGGIGRQRVRHAVLDDRAAAGRDLGETIVEIYLVDGTYELFRHFYAMPSARDADGREVAAVKGVVTSILGLINFSGARYLGVATDHVIESFRNDMWPGYKTGAGIDPALFSQFGLLEEALTALGVAVWPMIEFEADDALASAAAMAAADSRVDRVVICTPDKDLGQCVRGTRVVQLNRRTRVILDEAGIIAKFGVAPESIPDYLALVGDSSDGYPGLRGLGAEIGGCRARAVPPPRSLSLTIRARGV